MSALRLYLGCVCLLALGFGLAVALDAAAWAVRP